MQLPKLILYDTSPFGLRARAIFGLKMIDYVLVFVAYHDEDTPLKLVGKKQTPILQLPSGEAFAESEDIVQYVDATFGGPRILQPAAARQDIETWQQAMRAVYVPLFFPRAINSPFPEFARKQSRDYFLGKKQQLFGSFEEMEKKTPELLPKANALLEELDGLLYSDQFVNEGGRSYDDLTVFSSIRGLILVKGIVWPNKVRSFVENFAATADIPLLDSMAQ